MKRFHRGVEYVSALVLLVICCGGRLYGVMPFGTAMFCALTCNMPRSGMRSGRAEGAFFGFVTPVYILFSFLFSFELWRLYLAGAAVFVMAVRWFLSLKLPKMSRPPAKLLFSIGAIVIEGVLMCVFSSVPDGVISGAVALLFLYFAMLTAGSAMNRFAFRLSVPEAASVCVTLAVAGLTFGRAVYGDMDIGIVFAYFCALMLCVIGVKAALAGGIALSIGLGFTSVPVAFAFMACVAAVTVFRVLPRPIYSVVGVGVFAAFCVLFGIAPETLGINSILLAAGALMFCIIPRRAVRALNAYFDFDGSARLAVRHYINRVKADAGNRMLTLASVFDETARLMNAFGAKPPDTAAAGAALRDGVCSYCHAAQSCDAERAGAAFCELAERAYSGRAVITELPEFFTGECARTAEVISAAGALSDRVRERKKKTEGEDKARAIVTDRLAAIKDVLKELGAGEAAPVGFDGDAEKKIALELCSDGIECAEAFVTRSGVTAIVRSAAADREKLRRAVYACMKKNYEVRSLEKTQAAGWSVATLKKRPGYEAVYARAGVAKSGGVSGDSYAFERIEDRFLTALLDGMGTGAEAGESSGTAIELIEAFYRAGFDSQSALSGVNRFLKLPSSERFSAADVAVCDLDTASVDIIKIGSPPCYIKTSDTVLKIEGSSLPIGVLDEMRPYVTTKRLYPGQTVVLVTDGVSDCFSGDELPSYINDLPGHNPERLANDIISRCLKLCGDKPRDDMTVVAFRLIERKGGKFIA